MPYVTLEEVCQHLRWDPTNASVSQDVELYIPIASDLVEQYCGGSFEDEPGVTKTLDGKGYPEVWFTKFARSITLVESLDTDGEVIEEIEDALLWPNDPRTKLYRGLERPSARAFAVGRRNIRVTGDWGLESTPNIIKLAISFTIKHLLDYSLVNEFIGKESAGGRYVELRDNTDARLYIPKMSQTLLASYRNTRLFD